MGTSNIIELVPITPENYELAMSLAVGEDQQAFVASVQKSLADAYVYKESIFRIAYQDKIPVGYLLLFPYEKDRLQHVNIVRLMIDQKHQGQGLGRSLLHAALQMITSLKPPAKVVRISTLPTNSVAISLYRSHGFIERGMEEGEIALYLTIGA